jgi:hypothetical protein
MKELRLVLDPKTAAHVALALRTYASEQQDKLIDTVAAAIEAKLAGRRGRYN